WRPRPGSPPPRPCWPRASPSWPSCCARPPRAGA
ncbi:MAG: hypothetical protein AVDCRST_MAG66-4048, partial [uncultured Pseudonocardia sp.]